MKRSKKLRFLAEYAGLKCLTLAIRLMPWVLAVKFGEFFGLLVSKMVPKRFARSVEDIKKTFPQKTPREAAQIAKESFKNIGRMTAEFVKASAMDKNALLKRVELRNFEPVLELNNKQNLGGIMHIGHFVNWEITGLVAGHIFAKMAFVARPQSNPYVNAEINKMRTSSGSVMISAYNPFFQCFKYLKKGYMLGILSDQSVVSSEIYMNFLGRAAEVGGMTAVLAIKMQLPVYPVRPYREGGKIIIEIQPPLTPPAQYSQQAVIDFTRRLTDKYEEWIKQTPQDWLWAHNRWKREKQTLQKMAAQGGRNA
ncbi:MAG: lysophospholipid acyltransferase family protein [Elusimicrobiota bacterium]|nr:lysophospholipid acyltransferase family protein [Elusimicrobiota bacterium]